MHRTGVSISLMLGQMRMDKETLASLVASGDSLDGFIEYDFVLEDGDPRLRVCAHYRYRNTDRGRGLVRSIV